VGILNPIISEGIFIERGRSHLEVPMNTTASSVILPEIERKVCQRAVLELNSKKVYIGAIAMEAGLSIDTVRFYEKQCLLKPPPRTQAGYRLYGAEELRTLRFITRAQRLGFSLQEIRQLVDIQRCPGGACEKTARVIEEKLAHVRKKIKQLCEIECSLENALGKCNGKRKTLLHSGPDCPVLNELAS
jgi:DNA-binding transcriptional MerR regulator